LEKQINEIQNQESMAENENKQLKEDIAELEKEKTSLSSSTSNDDNLTRDAKKKLFKIQKLLAQQVSQKQAQQRLLLESEEERNKLQAKEIKCIEEEKRIDQEIGILQEDNLLQEQQLSQIQDEIRDYIGQISVQKKNHCDKISEKVFNFLLLFSSHTREPRKTNWRQEKRS